ncbi:PAS domain S-box protein [Natrialbaceae archaeon A-CW1-1]
MGESTYIVYVDPGRPERIVSIGDEIGFVVDHVTERTDCLERLETADCVVTEYDLDTPGTTGLELCQAIRERRPDLPVLIYTASGSEAVAGEAIAMGAAGYVPKSQGVNTLVTRILEVVVDGRARSVAGSRSASTLANSEPDSDAEPDTDAASGTVFEAGDPHLERLVDQSPVAIIEWTLDFEVRRWNGKATDLFGYEREEALGTRGTELLVPADGRDAFSTWWEEWLSGTPTSSHGISRNVHKSGLEFRCEWYSSPLVDDTGTVRSVLSFVRDATTEFRRSAALETLQTATRKLMQTSSVDDIGDIVIEATDEIVDGALAGVRIYDEESDTLEAIATSKRLQQATDEIPPIEPGNGTLWNVYATGTHDVIEDASVVRVPYDIDDEVGNAVIHPLGTYGLLSVASSGATKLEDVDINLIQLLAATAEAALERAERERELERAKTLVETVGDSMYAIDTDGRFVMVNDTLSETTGYDRERLLGEHASLILTDDSLARSRREVGRLIDGDADTVATYDVDVVTADGDRIPCEVNTTLLETEGEKARTVGIVRDVSDRKLMERELSDRRAKMEKLHEIASRLDECENPQQVYDLTVETAEDVLEFDVCVFDTVQGEYLVTEAVSSTIHDEGYSNRTSIYGGIAGKTHRHGRTYRAADLRSDDDADPEQDAYRAVLSVPVGDRGVFQAVSTDIGAFDSDDQELTELLLSHVSDTLDRLAFESQLKEERDRFVALFENVPDAVVSTQQTDRGPVVERLNPAFERIFGYDGDDLSGELLDPFVVPSDQTEAATEINRRGNQGEPIEAEVKRRTTNGLRDFMMRVVPIEMHEHSDRAFGLYTDITEQKQRQKRVEILNRVLRHDLRNGMNIINGSAEMLAAAVDDEADKQFAEAIQERASELISLAEKTRAVERTLDRDDAAMGPIDVVERLEAAIDRIEREYPRVNISIFESIPDRIHARADEMVEDAIYHVLENAIEHSDRDEPTVEVALAEEDGDEEMVVVTVVDDGPGIPDDERALLQEDEEITQLRHASGLGLWLVNWVVTQSGGQLTFQENEPRGTVVRMALPTAEMPTHSSALDGTAASD